MGPPPPVPPVWPKGHSGPPPLPTLLSSVSGFAQSGGNAPVQLPPFPQVRPLHPHGRAPTLIQRVINFWGGAFVLLYSAIHVICIPGLFLSITFTKAISFWWDGGFLSGFSP